MKIFKYQIQGYPGQGYVTMPKGAKVLKFALQAEEPMLWAEVDDKAPLETRLVFSAATGVELPPFVVSDFDYVDSFVSTYLVWHVYVRRAGDPIE